MSRMRNRRDSTDKWEWIWEWGLFGSPHLSVTLLKSDRGERIRTSDLSVPNRAHYQAVLRPDMNGHYTRPSLTNNSARHYLLNARSIDHLPAPLSITINARPMASRWNS
jgi:hypothetical protein